MASGGWVEDRHRLTQLEASQGIPWGEDPSAPDLPPHAGTSPKRALETVITAALLREPCLVTFSGGRDSSAVLALACDLARREGLSMPVAVTNVFPNADATREDEWQRAVVDHLQIENWVRLRWSAELDLVGPYAARVLDRSGPLFPFNAHFLEPLVERAAGGTLLTGVGGDELFNAGWRPSALRLLYRRRLPPPRRWPSVALELAPRTLRAAVYARRHASPANGWLRPQASRQIRRLVSRADAAAPVRWDRGLELLWRTRYVQCLSASLNVLGAAHQAEVVSPFIRPSVIRAFAEFYGRKGPDGRAAALSQLFPGLLPEATVRRRTKAVFQDILWSSHAREFARRWDGAGIDPHIVDPDALAAEWANSQPSVSSYSLLQHAWLASKRGPR